MRAIGAGCISKIAELRLKASLTQKELAAQVDVTETTIRNWETGRSGLEWFVRIAKLCKALNCSPEDLVEFISVENPENEN